MSGQEALKIYLERGERIFPTSYAFIWDQCYAMEQSLRID
jgi:hypothetical protein